MLYSYLFALYFYLINLHFGWIFALEEWDECLSIKEPKYTPTRSWSPPNQARGAIISLITPDHSFELTFEWFNRTDTYLLSPYNYTWILFYDYRVQIDPIMSKIGLRRKRNQKEKYVSSRGTLILTRKIYVNFPDWLADDMSILDEPGWRRCSFIPQTDAYDIGYLLYTQAFAYHILRNKILEDFDFFLKLDTDITFTKMMPFDVFADMANRKCILGYITITHEPQCSINCEEALLSFGRSRCEVPLSFHRRWCHGFVPWSAFMVGWTGFFRSKENLELAKYLFNYKEGGFHHRWTDQGYWFKFMCMWLDLENFNHIKNVSKVCNYRSLISNDIFMHHQSYQKDVTHHNYYAWKQPIPFKNIELLVNKSKTNNDNKTKTKKKNVRCILS